jgi:hypothetical protein
MEIVRGGDVAMPWKLNGMNISQRHVLNCVTSIFGARISVCPQFVYTEKCGRDLGKAGQTTSVSISTHGP